MPFKIENSDSDSEEEYDYKSASPRAGDNPYAGLMSFDRESEV